MTKVASFYRFTDVSDPAAVRKGLQRVCEERQLLGTVLLAREGINGTLAGGEASILHVFGWLENRLGLDEPLEGRWTEAAEAPFRRMRVRLKKEIVALGRPDIRPDRRTGQRVGIEEWNSLLRDPATVIIDTRNHYEHEVGTFRRAIDPETDSFRQFPEYARQLAAEGTDRKLAMFCTGGIRCEKASALMMELGFRDVYQLDGGILRYLEEVADDDNLWDGECFVFDTRVAVDRDRAEGGYEQCHACRRPLSANDLSSPLYREGVSCPRCADSLDADRRARLEERRRQVRLARVRGKDHIGARLD
jgi:UPF0176 protein